MFLIVSSAHRGYIYLIKINNSYIKITVFLFEYILKCNLFL